MWSHYADGLRGFCIEYEPTTILGDNPKFASIYDVLYQNTPAVIDTALEAVHSDQIDYHGNAIEASTSESEIELLDEKLYENVLKSQEIYMKMLATKPKEWSYEEEKRIIYLSTDRDDSLLAYPSSSIKRVIFGEKMPQNQVQTILNLFAAKGLSLTVQYARRASSAFKVELVERI
nr:DUF2971 domain-containing protein [Vibrio europaeus]